MNFEDTMSAEKLFSEILEEFELAESRAEKLNVLRKYDHPRLRDFFVATFNPNIQFDVEIPAYRPAEEPAGLNWTYLDLEMNRIYRFVKGHSDNLTQEKKKSLLVVVLESLHKDEAALMVKMLKKDLGVKGLTVKILQEAYPGIKVE